MYRKGCGWGFEGCDVLSVNICGSYELSVIPCGARPWVLEGLWKINCNF